ncbi:hypothetical protein PPERSA_02901 [Pseudocohnilembus persalinus]|uniref:Leucine rich repeat protein n=1 Tax=Pseudocohnilembus persalinus TaxID=266149 RepID=A0A0V0QMP0_PSEPJ|nr:hypothetical protein PPERSA_02901 [Pseudocohnilembus persalinus]|eukprot:KRX03522.1 hypothetical protein PPERSA_02901 [Pseudocohnilembus persalinus]
MEKEEELKEQEQPSEKLSYFPKLQSIPQSQQNQSTDQDIKNAHILNILKSDSKINQESDLLLINPQDMYVYKYLDLDFWMLELYLNNIGFMQEWFSELKTLLENVNTLQHLKISLSNNPIQGIEQMVDLLQNQIRLDTLILQLSFCNITFQSLQSLQNQQFFPQNLSRINLDLSGNILAHVEDYELGFPAGIFNLPNLKVIKLSLSGNELRDYQFYSFIDMFLGSGQNKDSENNINIKPQFSQQVQKYPNIPLETRVHL